MKEKTIAIVLGGTNAHIALINNLKIRGYSVILIDYLENPPAKIFADEHLRESTLDREKVLELATNIKASLVISTSIDQANNIACYVAEKLSLPRPYSYETALNVTDKLLMKKIMIENGIPTSKFISIEDFSEFDDSILMFPLVVKPSDSTGSKGVRKANSNTEVKCFFDKALKISRNEKVIIEEYVNGKEIQIDCFISQNQAKIIMIRQKNPIRVNGNFTMQTMGSSIPTEVSEVGLNKIQQISNHIASVFNLYNTPLFIQAIIDKNDNIIVVEFAPRVGGGLSYRLIELYTGFNFLNASIDSYLNITPTIEIKKNNFILESVIIYSKAGIYDRITGHQKLLEDKVIEEFFFFVSKGMQISSDMSTKSRVGAFIIKADSKEELNKKIITAINALQVFDVNGTPIMRKDIYKKLDATNSMVP